MKIIDNIKKHPLLFNGGILLIGVLLGWLFFGGAKTRESMEDGAVMEEHDHEPGTIWTCSMHPQIREDEPGKCPICGMDLVEVETSEVESMAEVGDFTVRLTNTAMKIAEIQTSTIDKRIPHKKVYLPGKVMADERSISELTARYAGRIEKLYVNFKGQRVRRGQVLAKIYSPELITAQRELFEASKFRESNPKFYEAARNKLKLWNISEDQIQSIEESGEVQYYFNVLSPLTGTVTMRHVSLGDYIKEGSALFEIVNLGHVWVVFNAYESDLPWVKVGDEITFTIKSIPGRTFTSKVTFIDPVIDPKARVAGVRTELDNPDNLLKPEMLASGILEAKLGTKEQLVLPKSAVLWTGKKSVVYVLTNDQSGLFQYREVTLGAEAGDYYVLEEGLKEGESVATNGVFKIDGSAQLQGKQSMMNPEGGKVSLPHDHGNMDNDESETTDHDDHNTPTSNNSGQNEGAPNETFKSQLTEVYKAQFDLQDAFLASSVEKAKTASSTVKKNLAKVDMNLLSEEEHSKWMNDLKGLNESLDKIISGDNLIQQRLAYAEFNDTLYTAIKYFGIAGETIYYQYCPMARNNEGAHWLSPLKEIRNPYMGVAMLTCGENKEIIQ